MARMSPEQTQEFLSETHLAHLVTLKPGGYPHVAPVWFIHRRDTFLVMTYTGAVKYRNLLQDARVALSIASEDRPYRTVSVEGTARVGKEDLEEIATAISVKYRGPDAGQAYTRELLQEEDMVIVAIEAARIMSWTSQGEESGE